MSADNRCVSTHMEGESVREIMMSYICVQKREKACV